MAPYPTASQIEEIFANRENPSIFNTHLADDVDVSVVGVDFHIAGHYKTPQAFHDNIWGRMTAVLKLETLRIEVRRVIGGGESPWAAVESSATATSKSGEWLNVGGANLDYFIDATVFHPGEPLHNNFVDLVRFNTQWKIAEMKEFFDSEHVHRHVDAHEKKNKQAEK